MEETGLSGLFITFEGPDGAGKTTQIKLLYQYLIEQGYEVVLTREPGGTNISDKIRQIILDPDHRELKDQTEVLLYASSRAQLVHETIIPSLQEGKIVLCDRFIDASIAYQAYGLELNRSVVEKINQFASSDLNPHRTYLIYISPEEGRKRLEKRGSKEFSHGLDRIEQKEIEYHRRVSAGFLQLQKENPKRILKIDADHSIEAVFDVIKNDINLFLQENRRKE